MNSHSKHKEEQEKYEKDCFEAAFQAAMKQGGKTAEIMTYLHGTPPEDRNKQDSPDLVRICKRGKKTPREIVVGIEHFQVSQASKKKGAAYRSVDKAHEAELWKIYKCGHIELESEKGVSESTGKKLLNTATDYVIDTISSDYKTFLDHLNYVLNKHLDKVKDYRENLGKIPGGRKVELAFFIEIQTCFQELFLNDQTGVRQVRGAIMPLFKEVVQALSRIDKNDIDYIILWTC